MAQADLELTRRGYAAFQTGDIDTLRAIIAEDVTWHVSGHNQLSGTYEGHKELFEFFGKVAELTEGTLRQDVHDMLESDDHVVVLLNVTATRDGKTMEGHRSTSCT